MIKTIGLTLAASTMLATAAFAATPQRIRGTVTSITGDALVVQTKTGPVTIGLTGTTRYNEVVKADLASVDKDSYIGTATKEVGGKLIALEVLVFPSAMRGAGEGHYGWDSIPDTTLAGSGAASSTMTNGTVATVQAAGGTANSSMTNGTVATTASTGGVKQITVTYKGGEQTILVPPTAPIVTFKPGTMADVTAGKVVFIGASNDDGKITANSVNVGTPGAPPPM